MVEATPSGRRPPKRRPIRVAVLYNVDYEDGPEGDPGYAARADVCLVAASIASQLTEGHEAHLVPVDGDMHRLRCRLADLEPDCAFNLCESLAGDTRLESAVPLILELLGIPFTGSPPEALSQALYKDRVKRCLESAGVPTPAARVMCSLNLVDRLSRTHRYVTDAGPGESWGSAWPRDRLWASCPPSGFASTPRMSIPSSSPRSPVGSSRRPGSKAVGKLPNQILEALRFQVLEVQRVDRLRRLGLGGSHLASHSTILLLRPQGRTRGVETRARNQLFLGRLVPGRVLVALRLVPVAKGIDGRVAREVGVE